MHEEGKKVELVNVPMPVRAKSIKATVPLSRTWDGVPSAGLKVGWRVTPIAVSADLLPSEPRDFKCLVEICVDVILLVRRQTSFTVAVGHNRDRVPCIVVVGVPQQLHPELSK